MACWGLANCYSTTTTPTPGEKNDSLDSRKALGGTAALAEAVMDEIIGAEKITDRVKGCMGNPFGVEGGLS